MDSGWIAPIVLVGVCLLSWLWSLLTAPRFDVRGKHVLFTGAALTHFAGLIKLCLTDPGCNWH
jgi:hypothetical protein